MKYEILETGSSGNCTIINERIAIDIGVSFKKIAPYEKDLKLVLLTHEHRDHFMPSTIKRLAKDRPTLRFGCCEWLAQRLLECGVRPQNIDLYEINGFGYHYGEAMDFTIVQPERLTHNVPNCGYHVAVNGEWLFYATDTGSLDGIEAKNYALYLVEANHLEAEIEARAEEKLNAGEFAYETAAAENHLSYEKAIEWLKPNMGADSIWVPMHQHKERGAEDGRKTDAIEQDH
jgi:hypothetical protein